MTRLAKILIAGTAMMTLPLTPAFAEGSTSDILNGQVTLNSVWSNTNTTVDGVNGDVQAQAVGAGNVLDGTTMNDTNVNNDQYATSPAIGADLNASVTNVGGSVGLTTQTACNSADVSTDPHFTNVSNNQVCAALDPAQKTDVTVGNVVGDVAIAGSSVGNTYSEDTNATNMSVASSQINKSNVFSTTNATVNNVGGSVSVSSTAIGNNAQIIHY